MLADVLVQMPILPFFHSHKSNINETEKNRVKFVINDEIFVCALNSNDRSIHKKTVVATVKSDFINYLCVFN